MKTKILGIFALAIFSLCAAVFFSESIAQHGIKSMEELLEDPVVSELMAYVKAADEVRNNPSSTVRLAHYQEWKKRFQKIIADHPDSEFIGAAKSKLLGLYNGLGEYDKSQTQLQELVDTAKSPEEKIAAQNELGEVSRARYWTSQDTSELKKSQEAFEQADNLFRSLPPEKQEGPLGGQQIVNLCIAAAAAREANDHEKSAILFQSARKLFQTSNENAKHAVLSGYDLEAIAEQEMFEWILIKKEAEALQCLGIFTNLPSFRWCPSYYTLKYAELFYKNNSKGFQDFVSMRLVSRSFDERTPILMARLGFSYFDNGLYEKALPIFEILRNKHLGDFQKLEPKAFQDGEGGLYEQVLYDLIKIYLQRGDANKADNVKTELINLLPQSALGKLLTEDDSSSLEDGALPERSRYLVLRICCVTAGILLIVWGLYLRWGKDE